MNGQLAIKDTLRAVLKGVEPDRRMISPEQGNRILHDVREEAEAATKPDDS